MTRQMHTVRGNGPKRKNLPAGHDRCTVQVAAATRENVKDENAACSLNVCREGVEPFYTPLADLPVWCNVVN